LSGIETAVFRAFSWSRGSADPVREALRHDRELSRPNIDERSSLGDIRMVAAPDKDGNIHALAKRCTRRGSLFSIPEQLPPFRNAEITNVPTSGAMP
jgi:hypothetical protein